MKSFYNESIIRTRDPSLAAVIMDVIPLVRSCIRSEMRSSRTPGLSLLQFRALIYLYRHKNVSLSELAEHINLKLPSTSKLIDALVERGLVVRRDSAQDRRRISLKLSANGLDELTRTRDSAEERLSMLLADLNPEQQSGIIESLTLLKSLFTGLSNPEDNKDSDYSGKRHD